MIFKNIDLVKLFQMMKEHDVAELTLRDRKTTVEVKRNREPSAANLFPSLQSSSESVPQAIVSVTEDKTMEAVAEEEKKPSLSRESFEENIHTGHLLPMSIPLSKWATRSKAVTFCALSRL